MSVVVTEKEKVALAALADDNIGRFVDQVDYQIESLLKNEKKIENYHNEDKQPVYGSDLESSASSMSAETISSLNDDFAKLIF